MQVVVEVAAVLPGVAVEDRLALGCDADHAHHRAQRERDAIGHVHGVAVDAEDLRHRRLHVVDQLADAGDQRREPALGRPHGEQLDDE